MNATLDYAAVDRAATDLLKSVFKDLDKLTYPIDLSRVIEHCKLTIKQGEFNDKNIEGALDRKSSTIYLSKNDSFEEKNFTIAHEIGHLKLHEDVQTDIFTMQQLKTLLKRQGEDIQEDQADLFAASLLIPEKPLRKFWQISHDVELLAQVFGVPKEAIELRLDKLRLLT